MANFDTHLRGPSRTEGMGGFLDPPGYPTHTYSIGEGRRSNPHSLSSLHCVTAADPEWMDPAVIAQAKALIQAWHDNRPALDSPEVQAWIVDCYRHWDKCWYSAEPDTYGSHVDYALHHIRQFYPEFNGR